MQQGFMQKGAQQQQKMQFAVKFSVDIIYGYKPHYGADRGDPFPIGCNALLSHKESLLHHRMAVKKEFGRLKIQAALLF